VKNAAPRHMSAFDPGVSHWPVEKGIMISGQMPATMRKQVQGENRPRGLFQSQ